jgi:amino acid transporter
MLGRFIRVLLALTAIAPLSVSLAYIYGTKEQNIQMAFIAACFCILLGAAALWIIRKSQEELEPIPITINKVKSADKEVIGFFVAYVLPLVFRGQPSPDVGALVLAACMLFFVLSSTHSILVNPVLGLFKYHFYEVETADGITYLLISKRRIGNALTIKHVVLLGEYGVLEAPIQSTAGDKW